MDEWRGRINEILYTLQFRPRLDDAVADDLTRLIANRQVLTAGADVYAASIRQALADPGPLDGQIGTPHSEATLRAFLARLDARLSA